MTKQAELVGLLAELDQQLAAAEDGFFECHRTIAAPPLRDRIIHGLRVAQKNVERQLKREMVRLAGNQSS